MALPATLDFSPKLGAAQTRVTNITVKSNSTNTYSSGSTIYFDIPIRANAFLDQSQSYISLNLKANEACELDNSIYSAFKSLTIVHGSNILERIDNYNVICGILKDFSTSQDAHATSLNCMMGCEADRKGKSLAAATYYSFMFPLLSGLFSHCQKYLPLASLNNSLQIQLTVNDDKAIFVDASTPTVTIANPELHLSYLELSPESYNAVRSANGGQYQFYGKTWKANQYTITPSAGNTYSQSVPARYRSVTDYIICLRRSSDLTDYAAYSSTGRVMGGLSQLQVRVADQVFPQSPINCEHGKESLVCNAFAETMRSFNSLYNGDFCSNVTYDGFFGSTGATVTTNKNAGTVLCVNTEAYSGRSHTLMSGLNCLSANTQIDFTWGSTVTIGTAVVDVFVECDVLFTVDEFGQLNATI